MSLSRPVLSLILVAATVAATGCQVRGGQQAQGGPANSELYGNVQHLEQENARLKAENKGLKEQVESAKGGTIGETFAGDLPEGTSRSSNGGVILSDDFAFAKGSAELNAAGSRAVKSLADQLISHKGMIQVVGHTDATPMTRAYNIERYGDNWGLSAARSAAVVRALISSGVPAARIQGGYRGDQAPLGGDKSKDRRVEIYLLP